MVFDAGRLEELAVAAEARARRCGHPRALRSGLAYAEALRRRARELRALAARPRLVLVIAEPTRSSV